MRITNWLSSIANANRIVLNRSQRRRLTKVFPRANQLFRLVVAAAATSLIVAPSNGDEPLFPAPQMYAGGYSVSVAIDDVNGDDIADLIVSHGPEASVSVLPGEGLGGFSDPVTISTGADAYNVLTGDFNSDGFTDVATSETNSVTVLLGNGDLTFADPVSYPAKGQHDLATGDFNGDGVTDLATVSRYDGSFSVLLGVGDGTFSAALTNPVSGGPNALIAEDFNGDGVTDLATSNVSGDNVSVFLAVSDGTFLKPTSYVAGDWPSSMTSADFNGDGFVDLATANYSSHDVSVLFGLGDGTFTDASNLQFNAELYYTTSGDFNGDDIEDLVVGTSISLIVLPGAGDGTFNDGIIYSAGGEHIPLVSGDLNGDSTSDLAIPFQTIFVYRNRVGLLLSGCDGRITSPETYPAGTNYSIAKGDFNGDGFTDLAANRDEVSISVLLGFGDGSFGDVAVFESGGFPTAIATGDFNDDGFNDLVTANYGSNNVSVLLAENDGTFPEFTNYEIVNSLGPVAITTGYFDADEHLDLATANRDTDDVSIFFGGGDGTFSYNFASFLNEVGPEPNSITTADFNQDGLADLATANGNSLTVLLGAGTGLFQDTQDIVVGEDPRSIITGDFNHDRTPDLAVVVGMFPDPDSVTVLLGKGDGDFVSQGSYAVDSGTESITAGDFNSDGIVDFAARSDISVICILLGVADGTFLPCQIYAATAQDSFGNGITAEDFSQDGLADLATSSSRGLTIHLNQRRGGIRPGDVNLDCVVDLLDVAAFVELLMSGEYQFEGDINQDGVVDLLDVDPFVDLLS